MQRSAGSSIFVRNAIFGIEDSLAATVGLLSGLAAESIPLSTLILTGFIYIFVEAFSMGIGSFLSEESAEEYEGREAGSKRVLYASLVMFVACVVAGFVPLVPYFFLSGASAIWASALSSVGVLGVLGLVQARLSRKRAWPRVLRMVILGGTAIAVGVLVGRLVNMV